ncbi:hypothetical protein ACFX15_003416 [Malus domestica]
MVPGRRAHNSPGGWRRFEGSCRASISLSGLVEQVSSGKSFIGQDSSGKACRARLKEKDKVNLKGAFVGP